MTNHGWSFAWTRKSHVDVVKCSIMTLVMGRWLSVMETFNLIVLCHWWIDFWHLRYVNCSPQCIEIYVQLNLWFWRGNRSVIFLAIGVAIGQSYFRVVKVYGNAYNKDLHLLGGMKPWWLWIDRLRKSSSSLSLVVSGSEWAHRRWARELGLIRTALIWAKKC